MSRLSPRAFVPLLSFSLVRNAYLLIKFGDFDDGLTSSATQAYIQLYPITNRATAHADFVNVRMKGVDTSGLQRPLLPASQGQTSPTSSKSAVGSGNNDLEQNTAQSVENSITPVTTSKWFILTMIVLAAFVLLLIGFCLMCLLRRRRSKVLKERVFVPPMRAYEPVAGGEGHASGGGA